MHANTTLECETTNGGESEPIKTGKNPMPNQSIRLLYENIIESAKILMETDPISSKQRSVKWAYIQCQINRYILCMQTACECATTSGARSNPIKAMFN